MKTQPAIVLFALLTALGLVTVVAVDVMLTAQEAEARGCRTSIAFNASQGRCFGHGPAAELSAAEENQEGDDNRENEGEDDGGENDSEDNEDNEDN